MDAVKIALFLLTFASLNPGEQAATVQNLNWLTDSLIESATKIMQKLYNGSLAIPDVEETFQKKVLFFKIAGGLKATGGVFSNLTTLHRTGDTSLTLDNNNAKLRLHLGLGSMQIHFNHCRVWLGRLSASESIQVNVMDNSLEGEIFISGNAFNCKATVDYIKIKQFSDIDISVKGLGLMNRVLGTGGDWIMNNFKDIIKPLVEEQLQKHISEELPKHNTCLFLL